MKTTTVIKILTATLFVIISGFVIESIQSKSLYTGADFICAISANVVLLSAFIAKKNKEDKDQNSKDDDN